MTANSSLPLAAVIYDRQTPSRASSNAPALDLAIDHSQSLDHVCGTVYLMNFVIPLFPRTVSLSANNAFVFELVPCGLGVVRIDPLRFLAGCRKKRLNQALSILSLSLGIL